MAIEGVTELLKPYFEQFNYTGPFVLLLACGLGFPLPEEATLLLCGWLLDLGYVDFTLITVVCGCAILIGDSIPYWLGRVYGMRALQIRWVRRILHPERFAKLEARFREHGNWWTFACRFFAGVRIPGYFIAGTMGMGYVRFLLLDTLGVLISVPASIWLGKFISEHVADGERIKRDLHYVLIGIGVAVVLFTVVRILMRRAVNRALPRSEDEPGARP